MVIEDEGREAGSFSKRLLSAAGVSDAYMSRAVKGPENRKISDPGSWPGERSMWKVEPFQI